MNSYAAKQVSGVMDQKDYDVVGVFAKGYLPQFKYPWSINPRKSLDFSETSSEKGAAFRISP